IKLFLFSILIYNSNLISQSNQLKFELVNLDINVKGTTNPLIYYELIQTKESPFALWTFMYENVYERFGAKKEFFEPLVFTSDLLLIKRFLDNNGYFNYQIDTSLIIYQKDKTAALKIKINEGIRSKVDTFKIEGFELIDDKTFLQINKNQKFNEGDFYNREFFDLELNRINKILFNNGYQFSSIDTVIQLRYLSTNNLSIKLKYDIGKKYKFGKINLIGDTLLTQPEIIFRHLDFKEGDVFSEALKISSDQNINQLGIFEYTRIEFNQPKDTISDKLPIEIFYKTNSDLREILPEVLINDENYALNTGVGLSFNHKNFFGDARKFTTKLRFSFQSLPELDVKNVIKKGTEEKSLLTKTDLNIQLMQPYFFTTRTTSTFDGILEFDNQKYYSLNTFRTRFGVNHKFATFTKGFLDWNIERVAIVSIDTTKVDINTFTGQRQKQFNTMLGFTIQRDLTNDYLYPSKGFFHSFQIEESGTLSRSLSKLSEDLPFSEYLRFNFIARHFYDIGRIEKITIMGFKLKTGFSYLYNPNNRTPMPPSRKFYMGGGSSVRGWKSRSLGAIKNPEQGGYIFVESSAEIRYQLFSRSQEIFFLDLSKLGVTFFMDAGSVWDSLSSIKISDVAIAGGVGFRYNTIVGPIRIDLGFRFYDPFELKEKQWITDRKFFGNAYSRIEIGLGHVF
ncbi:MAG: BamA/TamA family outer membrane protein, partial [Bacteroidetes bacterium]|nr:BamA/TamA family outer membrane protein [Bacteroidota bacterium]